MLLLSVLLHSVVQPSHSHAHSFTYVGRATNAISSTSARTATADVYGMYTNRSSKAGSSSTTSTTRSSKNNKTDSLEMDSICPGSRDLLANGGIAQEVFLPMNVSHCRISVRDPRIQRGVVFGKCSNSRAFCQYLIQVPRTMTVIMHMKNKASGCGSLVWAMMISVQWPSISRNAIARFVCYQHTVANRTRAFISFTNTVFILLYNRPSVQLWFEAVRVVSTVYTSKNSGYVTFDTHHAIFIKQENTMWTSLKAPHGHVFMISFEVFRSGFHCTYVSGHCLHCGYRLTLSGKVQNSNQAFEATLESGYVRDYDRHVEIYNTATLKLQLFIYGIRHDSNCMKMLFSIHPRHEKPQRKSNGLFNCSVDTYWTFQRHLDCNRKTECEDGRDETERCPFRNRFCTGDWVKSANKCFTLVSLQQEMSAIHAKDVCKMRGLTQGMLKTDEEIADFLTLFPGRDAYDIFIGLSSGWTSVPFMYSMFYKWSDNTVMYSLRHKSERRHTYISREVKYYLFKTKDGQFHRRMYPVNSDYILIDAVICEKKIPREKTRTGQPVTFRSVSLPSSYFKNKRQALIFCSQGHVTHEFLSCDSKTQCGQMRSSSACTVSNRATGITDFSSIATKRTSVYHMPMYACSVDIVAIPYPFVCDFMSDCPDQSDELFCNHPHCSAFACKDGPCVSINKHCDGQCDCLDCSDEAGCPSPMRIYNDYQIFNESWLINLDGSGYFTYRVMNDSEACPNTHYRCTTGQEHCLPVYTRCNGIYDCFHHEDERDCGQLVCPGFYRCRNSTVCVHVDHLCDGWPQCVQHDDEWMCKTVCPPGCLCQRHAFICHHPFSTDAFPQLRYLHAERSGMKLLDLQNSSYLVHLNLAHCFLQSLPDISLPNLQTFDLSYNLIENITLKLIYRLQNLQTLSLRGNPLKSLDTAPISQRKTALRHLDLSQTDLDVLDCQLFVNLPKMQHLNASFAQIRSIVGHGLKSVSLLHELDIRGSVISEFPNDLFSGLSKLSLVHASTYKLCCDSLLPRRVPATLCFAPQHLLSSCENMLRAGAHRNYLWFIGTVASLGSAACIMSHRWERESMSTSPSTAFLTNLQCANLCMGLYSVMIAAAHEAFRGQYYRQEDRWTNSAACKAAGFLSMLSSVVSALTIWLLTLDQFTALHTSLTVHMFSTRSAVVACGLTWIVGSLLASGPLLPGFEPWDQYGNTAVCSLMLNSENDSVDTFRFLHSTFIFKVMLCLMVTAGIAFIYKATPKNRLLVDQKKKPIFTSAHLLVKVALTDAVGCFSLAINSFATLGVGRSNAINIVMAVFVLPLNSALNPVLYLWHAVASRRQQRRNQRLLSRLKAQLKYKRNCSSSS